ncbi:hypothetical protein HYH02_003306 [Chlamydomonas schloesseri]|uniref:Uncharacterized protein n=1 Tax=Chlamydomonas schloesseri TaxID=2026947 RepID=A0A835WRS5_9CHLO|nr:hypothetical protein HYH02_003306 [Chlamydomonas schloesseri]|eukprot:KAG2452282.1 hypothetical protein HYH02_003306 [Chlamydomonas schloesseri]
MCQTGGNASIVVCDKASPSGVAAIDRSSVLDSDLTEPQWREAEADYCGRLLEDLAEPVTLRQLRDAAGKQAAQHAASAPHLRGAANTPGPAAVVDVAALRQRLQQVLQRPAFNDSQLLEWMGGMVPCSEEAARRLAPRAAAVAVVAAGLQRSQPEHRDRTCSSSSCSGDVSSGGAGAPPRGDAAAGAGVEAANGAGAAPAGVPRVLAPPPPAPDQQSGVALTARKEGASKQQPPPIPSHVARTRQQQQATPEPQPRASSADLKAVEAAWARRVHAWLLRQPGRTALLCAVIGAGLGVPKELLRVGQKPFDHLKRHPHLWEVSSKCQPSYLRALPPMAEQDARPVGHAAATRLQAAPRGLPQEAAADGEARYLRSLYAFLVKGPPTGCALTDLNRQVGFADRSAASVAGRVGASTFGLAVPDGVLGSRRPADYLRPYVVMGVFRLYALGPGLPLLIMAVTGRRAEAELEAACERLRKGNRRDHRR